MECNYDEDISENAFFREMQSEHQYILEQAPIAGWVLCIPRAGTARRHCLTENDFLLHVLAPSDELPETHFHTLSGLNVYVKNRVISVEHHGSVVPYETHIMFEEVFYTKNLMKYRVWCLEYPLDYSCATDAPSVTEDSNYKTLETLKECIDLLWTESMTKTVLEKIDVTVNDFLSNNTQLDIHPVQKQRDLVSALYTQCLQVAFSNQRIREKTQTSKHLLQNVKIAVESYILHGVYKELFKAIKVCSAFQDGQFNKTVRNLAELQLVDLGVRKEFYESVPCAKHALATIDSYSTVLGKVSCIKRTINIISKNNHSKEQVYVTVDDFLPIFVFLIIKTGLANWIAQITFLKQFRFSSTTNDADATGFLITSLEAAIEHIRSEALLGPTLPEAQLNYERIDNGLPCDPDQKNEVNLAYLFEQIRLSNDVEIRKILETSTVTRTNDRYIYAERNSTLLQRALSIEEILNDHTPRSLCHPLCSCLDCQRVLSARRLRSTPTARSCDDRGLTPLHIAAIHGRPQIIDMLLNFNASVNTSDCSGNASLHYSASRGHQNVLLLLMHAGAHLNMQNTDGHTALHLACNNGHDGCVKAMLYFAEHCRSDLSVNCCNNNGDTPLHFASKWGYESIVAILLEYGADANITNKHKHTPVHYAQSLRISRLLTESKLHESLLNVPVSLLDFAEPKDNGTEKHSATLHERPVKPQSMEQIKRIERLFCAIAAGDTKLACFFMGIDSPTINYHENNTPTECNSIRIQSCHPLCDCQRCTNGTSSGSIPFENKPTEKLNINICNAEGLTPLHMSALYGRSDMSSLLLEYGALPNIISKKGLTPLHLACQNQRIPITKQLLSCGNVNIDKQDSLGNTALHHAARTGNIRLVEAILFHEPELSIRNFDGKTVLKESEERMSLNIIKLLKSSKNRSKSKTKLID